MRRAHGKRLVVGRDCSVPCDLTARWGYLWRRLGCRRRDGGGPVRLTVGPDAAGPGGSERWLGSRRHSALLWWRSKEDVLNQKNLSRFFRKKMQLSYSVK